MRYRLRRRGVDHGFVTPIPRSTSWEAAEPVPLPKIVPIPDVTSAARLLDRLRRGEDLAPLLPPLPRGFRLLASSRNVGDHLEIEKAHVTASGRELYIKANWLSDYPGDGSLRLRFGFGTEILDDWLDDPAAARASERLFEAVFPIARCVTRNRRLIAAARRKLGAAPRFVQRILYSNSPGGGALFHHDLVPGQAGVVYAQLAGSTGWLTMPQRALAHLARKDPERAARLINHTPAFTRKVAAEGWFFVLRPGDAILLPSFSRDDVAWHSVFTLGGGRNIALSFGIAKKT